MQVDLIRNQDTDTELLQDMLTDFKSGFGMVNWNPSGCIADWYRFASGYWYRLDIRIAFRLSTFLNFAPQLPDLIVTSPETSPDVCVFPFKESTLLGQGRDPLYFMFFYRYFGKSDFDFKIVFIMTTRPLGISLENWKYLANEWKRNSSERLSR